MNFLHIARHLFIPHHSNNHRPKALHVDALLFYVLLLSVFNLSLRFIRTRSDVLGYATDIHAEQLLAGTNAQRASAGLSTLSISAPLSQAAAAKAQDMFAKGYWAHNSPDGKTPWDFIIGAGYRYSVAGENLAKNFSTSQGVVDAWMASPTHRANLLKGSYRDVGFAVVNGTLNGEETTLVVQIFGATPVPKAVVAQVRAAPLEIEKTAAVSEAPPKTLVFTPLAPVTTPAPLTLAFTDVTKIPKIDVPTFTRQVASVFLGILIMILAMDAAVIAKRGTVRVAGHNIAHILFFATILLFSAMMRRGSLL